MFRFTFRGMLAFTGLAFLASVSPAFALRVAAPPPGPDRMKQADVVVVGRIVGFNNQDVKVQNATYRVALVAVSDVIKGSDKQRMIRVGFVPVKAPKVQPRPGRPAIGIVPRPGIRQPQFEIGQHGLFYLKKHPKAEFYTAPMYYDFVASSNQENFKQELEFAKFTQKFGDHPEKAMESNDPDVRYTAAVIMVQDFRRPNGRPPYKLVNVDPKLSKKILLAIRDGDWSRTDQWAPMNLFYRLGVNAQDGFRNPQRVPGQPIQVYNEQRKSAIQTWLTKNADSYRIKKYVGGKGKNPRQPLPPNVRPVRPIQVQPLPIRPAPRAVPAPGAAPVRGVLPGIPPQGAPQQAEPKPK